MKPLNLKGRIQEIDIAKGMACFLMIASYLLGGKFLPASTFAAYCDHRQPPRYSRLNSPGRSTFYNCFSRSTAMKALEKVLMLSRGFSRGKSLALVSPVMYILPSGPRQISLAQSAPVSLE